MAARASKSRPRVLPWAVVFGGYILLSCAILGLGCWLGPASGDGGAGALSLGPGEVWRSLTGAAPDQAWRAWVHLRLVPLIFAAGIGCVLAVTGCVFQATLQNPLAEPYILGVSGAASLGVLLVQGFLGAALPAVSAPLGAFGGALAAIGCLLWLTRWAGVHDPATLILAGAVLNAIFGALILVAYALAEQRHVVSSLLWLMGSTGPEVTLGRPLALPLAVLTALFAAVVFWMSARWLDLLALGTEDAADLGIDPRRVRVVLLILASIATGLAVAVAGPIGFVGLVVPHCVRRLHGPGHRRLLPLAAVAGAAFLMLADLVARNVLRPEPLPVGAVTALVGGPFFLSLLAGARRRRVEVA